MSDFRAFFNRSARPTSQLGWYTHTMSKSQIPSFCDPISNSAMFATNYVNLSSTTFKLSLPTLICENLDLVDKYRPDMEYMYYSYCLSLAKKWTPITSSIIFGNMTDVYKLYNTCQSNLEANDLSVTTTNHEDWLKYCPLIFILLKQQQEIAKLVRQLDYLQNELHFVNQMNEVYRDCCKKLSKVRSILINLFKNKIAAPQARGLLDQILCFNKKRKVVKRKVVVNLIDDDSDDDEDIQTQITHVAESTQSDNYVNEEKDYGGDLILPVYGLSIAQTNKIVEEYAQRKEFEYYQANKLRVQTISLGNGVSSADEKDFPLVYAQKKEFEYYAAKKCRVRTYSDNSENNE